MAKLITKKTTILIGALVAIIIVSSWVLFSFQDDQSISQEEAGKVKEEISQPTNLIIDYGQGPVEIFQTEFKEGMTAFDLLKNKTEELNIVLKTKDYDFGILIEAIGDKENGEDGKYWLYYVNGELPMVSVDKHEIKSGDKVEFKFESSPF